MTDSDRQCQETCIAKQNGAYVYGNGKSWWWLRSPGYSGTAADVIDNGQVNASGNGVTNGYDVVRPALWLNL